MIRGTVNYDLEPVVSVEIEGSSGGIQAHPVVVDTAFSGELALPYDVIADLRLVYKSSGREPWSLATGQMESIPEYAGTIYWHGQPRLITVLETEGEFLLGASLLSGSRLFIDFRRGGEVLIEEDWPT